MDRYIICKFGGSSVANAGQIEKVKNIVVSNSSRRVVVVSAPGKGKDDEEKMTDYLINIGTEGMHFRNQNKAISVRDSIQAVIDKFSLIINDLGISGDDILSELEKDLVKKLPAKKKKDFMASRGEHFNARLIARYFENEGINTKVKLPEDIGLYVTDRFGNASILPSSYKRLKKLKNEESLLIIPGFYGVTVNNDIAVFSRGGSDLTGGELAYALDADLYENWTDTDGIYQVDPRIIPNSSVISHLTYKEIRLLSAKGFNVFHFDAMLKCKKKNIAINIKNTNNPSSEGTLIVKDREIKERVIGIARQDNIASLYLEKDNAGEDIAILSQLLSILWSYGVETFHYPTDKDDISVLINQNDLIGSESDLLEEIQKKIVPDTVQIFKNFSIISPVGLGMTDSPGTIADAAIALRNKNINIEIIDQGPAQISFHFGIMQSDADCALKVLAKALL